VFHLIFKQDFRNFRQMESAQQASHYLLGLSRCSVPFCHWTFWKRKLGFLFKWKAPKVNGITCRALIDSGTSTSYISGKLASRRGNHPPLPSNEIGSIRRLQSLERRLQQKDLIEDYNTVIEQQKQQGINSQ
jgi:hypothetical protein